MNFKTDYPEVYKTVQSKLDEMLSNDCDYSAVIDLQTTNKKIEVMVNFGEHITVEMNEGQFEPLYYTFYKTELSSIIVHNRGVVISFPNGHYVYIKGDVASNPNYFDNLRGTYIKDIIFEVDCDRYNTLSIKLTNGTDIRIIFVGEIYITNSKQSIGGYFRGTTDIYALLQDANQLLEAHTLFSISVEQTTDKFSLYARLGRMVIHLNANNKIDSVPYDYHYMFNKFASEEFTEITKDGKTNLYDRYIPFPIVKEL